MPTSPAPSSAALRATSLAILHAGRDDISAPPFRAVSTETPQRVIPFVPEAVLRRHHAFVATDGRLKAAYRLLAALWRQDQGLPFGTYIPERRRGSRLTQPSSTSRKPFRLGSRLSPAAARAGATFLSPAIASYAREALLFREVGSLWEEGRLWGNLLSSQAMTLNLLAPMALDLKLATAVWRILLPGFVGTVAGIKFEHIPDFFGERTAFDCILDVVSPEGEPAFVAIEAKYTEGAGGVVPAPRPHYTETTRASRLYRDPTTEVLFRAGTEQLRREHVISQLMIDNNTYARGYFILLSPTHNRYVRAMGQVYSAELIDAAEAPGQVGFSMLSLEAVVAAIAQAGAAEHASSFTARYLGLSRVVRCVLDTPLQQSLPRAPAKHAGRATAPTILGDLAEGFAKSI